MIATSAADTGVNIKLAAQVLRNAPREQTPPTNEVPRERLRYVLLDVGNIGPIDDTCD